MQGFVAIDLPLCPPAAIGQAASGRLRFGVNALAKTAPPSFRD